MGKNSKGISLTYKVKDSICHHNKTLGKSMTVDIVCDDSAKDELIYVNQKFNQSTCNMNLMYRSSKGCPVIEHGKVTDFVEQYKIPIGFTMIVLGIFLCFFGNGFLDVVTFLVTAGSLGFISCYAGFSIVDNLTGNKTQDWSVWCILVASALLGVGVAICLKGYVKFGEYLIVAVGGYILGHFITSKVAIQHGGIVYWVIIGACVIGAVVVFGFLEKTLIIIVTAIIGSICLVNGIMLFTGGYK